MSIYKRGGVWWIRFTTPDRREIRESAQTPDRRQAQEYHDRRKADSWRIAKLGESPRYTWQQAVVRWLEEHADYKALDTATARLRTAHTYFGGLDLDQIDTATLTRALLAYRATGVKASTANAWLAIVAAVLASAHRWGWLAVVPTVDRLPVTERRLRWLTRDEAARLIAELPDHLQPMVRFSLATGLRKGNVCRLEWNQVDLERRVAWIHADQAKGKRVIMIPLNADAVVVLREQQGQHPRWVFVREGQPILRPIASGWYPAVQRAGLTGVRWHDLRHTWASWHVQAGTPLAVLKELGGWASLDLVLRYAHLAPEHLAEHAERIAGPRLVRTNSGTPPAPMPLKAGTG
ncbi:MAG: site-specific integrase [Candidatus Contendobacter sp.]|jgi:integrase|nr:site-specific integrase [Candidatus Contendobacter sp.]